MKIKTFNENNKLNVNVEYAVEFSESLDDLVEQWISEIAYHTKLKKYTEIGQIDRKQSLKFAIDKKLTHFKKYLDADFEISKLEKKIEKLRELKDDKYYFNSASELLYNFQKELISKDIDNFYKFFLQDNIEYDNDHINDETNIFCDVHPKILSNKKLKSDIDAYLDASKYNL